MEINGINGGSNGTPNRFDELSSEDFMRIMFTELTNQDPLNPQDSSAMLEQIGAVRGIESNLKLMTQLEELVSQNKFTSAANLVGKSVVGLDEMFYPVNGRVAAVSIEGDAVVLTLDDGSRVPFDNVEAVYEPPSGEDEGEDEGEGDDEQNGDEGDEGDDENDG